MKETQPTSISQKVGNAFAGSSTLFDIQPLVSPRAAEVAPYTCKTCKYCERFRFGERVIYLYCTQKPLGKLHKRVKSYDKACMKYEHRRTNQTI